MIERLSPPFSDWLVDLWRELHQIPELKFREEKTAAKISAVLDSLGVPYQKAIAKTGIVARLKGKAKGPTVAFRADMDALPLEEDPSLPFRSRHEGCMHACGHDAHMTIGLGIIRHLVDSGWLQTGVGEILFFFQPAEEEGAGAKVMLDTGLFDDEPVQAIFAGHMDPEFPVGDVTVVPGTACAATNTLRFRIKGTGGHGAAPHLTRDPIVAGSHLVTQLQTIVSRRTNPLDSAVLTIGEFHAGTASNIIPKEAVLVGTLRALDEGVRQSVLDSIEAMVKGLESTFGVSVACENIEGYPVMVNDRDLAAFMEACVKECLGETHFTQDLPTMGAEDFGYFTRKWPGVMVGIGCHDPKKGFEHGLHSPYFRLDERALDVGVRLFVHALTKHLKWE
jgi:amidohydrolase